MHTPTSDDMLQARAAIAAHLPATPMVRSPQLSELAGADVLLKCECFAAIGSFKARGALACISRLPQAHLDAGLACASTGNHGAAMAWAAQQVGARCVVVVPTDTPAIKLANMKAAGADVVVEGGDWGESCAIARDVAQRDGLVYLEDGEDPWIMAGAGTVAAEIHEQAPDADTWLIPVGGGNLIAGCVLYAEAVGSTARIFGVQSESAPAVALSFRAGHIVERPTTTFAGGIATTGPVPAAFELLRTRLADVLLVSDDELKHAIGLIVRHHGIVVEGAGAAPLAALLRHRDQFAGGRTVLVLTGRNLDPDTLQESLARPPSPSTGRA